MKNKPINVIGPGEPLPDHLLEIIKERREAAARPEPHYTESWLVEVTPSIVVNPLYEQLFYSKEEALEYAKKQKALDPKYRAMIMYRNLRTKEIAFMDPAGQYFDQLFYF